MFCPNCGESLPDGSKFCGLCGANLSEVAVEGVGSQKSFESESNISEISIQPEYVQPKKKKDAKKLIGIVAVILVIVVAIGALKGLVSSIGNKDNAYVYLSNGKYELITNLKKNQTIEIASSKSDEIMYHLVKFSPDGKYVYYYTKFDSSEGTGSLCRAEYERLKENSSKNDKYIEVIATNVKLGFQFFDDGTLAYLSGDKTLYYFDGRETSQIAKSVDYFYTDDAKRVVYSAGDDSSGNSLYGVLMSDIDNKIKLASNHAGEFGYHTLDFENILYAKEDDNGNKTLYVVGFNKDSEKLVDNFELELLGDEAVYFTAENGSSLNLYDYVVDNYAAADSEITEPDIENFKIPTYSYSMLRGSDLSEDSYGELYTSCTRDLYWYGESTWRSYSMEEAMEVKWAGDSEAVHAATQRFIDKYAESADENGYILVTDEMKEALKDINRAAGEEEWEWLWLCYTREQAGETYDYDAYSAANAVYNEAKNRIEMRKALQDSENAYPLKTLYCYTNGEMLPISENVLDTYSTTYNGGIMFNTTDLIDKTENIENVSAISDVTAIFDIDYESKNYIVLDGETSICQMSESAAETFAEAENNDIVYTLFTDKEFYMREDGGALSVANVNNGIVEAFSIITDDSDFMMVDDSTLYYSSGSYENNGYTYCDLYSYSNGKATRLAQDVILDTLNIYSDDVIMAYTDYRDGLGYELTMIDSKGEKTFIADDVKQYIRVDDATLLYISGGDLYSYNGKERSMVQNDVDQIWSMNLMDAIMINRYDYDNSGYF